MNRGTKRTVYVFLLIVSSLTTGFYQKVTHGIDPEAKCLDGSSPALYVHSGSQPQNILIYFIGGGSCLEHTLQQSIEACYQRSKSLYGSSLMWPNTYSGSGLGVMELNKENKFAEWTKVAVLYCDGLTYQGNRKDPYEYKNTQLYFRGAVNTRAHIKWIDQQFSIQNSSKILLMGGSAGGMAVYMWVDYIRDMLEDPSKLYGVVDSGIFLDLSTIAEYVKTSQSLTPYFLPKSFRVVNDSLSNQNKTNQLGGMIRITNEEPYLKIPPRILRQFYQIANSDERPPNRRCLETLNNTSQDHKCLLSPKALETVETKLFFIQSQYDTDVIKLFLPVQCVSQGNIQFTLEKCSSRDLLLLDFYRGIVKTQVFDGLIKMGHSVWSNSCAWHVSTLFSYMLYNSKFHSGESLSLKQAIQNYVFNDAQINLQDPYPWPSNYDCAF